MHPFAKHNEQAAGKARAKSFMRADGGRANKDAQDARDAAAKTMRNTRSMPDAFPVGGPPGKKSGGRLDKFARGGRAKSKHKGNNTKINIVVAPKGPHPADGAAPPAPMGPPLLGGGPPPGLPPGGPPPGLGGPPPGLPAAGGPPGPRPPGLMARGGRLKMTAGAETGQGRLQKAKGYKARG